MILIVSLHQWTSTLHSRYPTVAILAQSAVLMKAHTTGHKHGPLCTVSYCVSWEDPGLKEESSTRPLWHLGHPGFLTLGLPCHAFLTPLYFPRFHKIGLCFCEEWSWQNALLSHSTILRAHVQHIPAHPLAEPPLDPHLLPHIP